MATYSTPPLSRSFLSTNKFDFTLDRVENFAFNVQSVNLPSISLSSTLVETPAVRIPVPGNQISFSPFSMTFIVDEDMQSWYELYNWMIQLGNPESTDKLGNLTRRIGFTNSITSTAALFIKTNSNNIKWKIDFYDVFPLDLGEIQFNTNDSSQEFATCSATFGYSYYDVVNGVNI